MSLLLSVVSGNLQLEGRSRTIQRVVLTAALTFAVALSGTNREIERNIGSIATKTFIQGSVREVERLRGSTTSRIALRGNVREIERNRGAVLTLLTGQLSLQGTSRNVERTLSSVIGFSNQQPDKGSRKAKPALPPEYRWPQLTPEQPHPLADVVIQAQIQDVPLPRNPALAIALRKAVTEKKVKAKAVKVAKVNKVEKIKDISTEIDDDDDLFFLT